MSERPKSSGGTRRGSSAPQKQAAIDALRYGPAVLSMRANTKQNVMETLGRTEWIAKLGGDDGEGGAQGKDSRWQLGRACGAVLAISAGREELRCALAQPDGRLTRQRHEKLYIEPPSRQRQAGPDAFEEVLARLLRDCVGGCDHAPIVAVAVAWAGRVDPRLNHQRGDPHPDFYLGDWNVPGISLADRVEKALARAGLEGNPPIYVVNDADANLMALAHSTVEDHEAFPDRGERRIGLKQVRARIDGSRVTLGVTIAGGVGGALMIAPDPALRRTLQRGSHGFVGELGQIPIDVMHPEAEKAVHIEDMTSLAELREDKGFPKWRPVYRETLDHYASGRSVVEQLEDSLEGGYNGRIVEIQTRLERDGDPLLEHVMNRSGRLIGQALIGPTLAIDPDLIVISSFAWSEDLLEGVQEVLGSSPARVGLGKGSIVLAPADPARTVKGAARWAIEARIAPVLEKVCSRGSGNKKLTDLRDELFQGAIWPPS